VPLCQNFVPLWENHSIFPTKTQRKISIAQSDSAFVPKLCAFVGKPQRFPQRHKEKYPTLLHSAFVPKLRAFVGKPQRFPQRHKEKYPTLLHSAFVPKLRAFVGKSLHVSHQATKIIT
jgi:hypothetical protein